MKNLMPVAATAPTPDPNRTTIAFGSMMASSLLRRSAVFLLTDMDSTTWLEMSGSGAQTSMTKTTTSVHLKETRRVQRVAKSELCAAARGGAAPSTCSARPDSGTIRSYVTQALAFE